MIKKKIINKYGSDVLVGIVRRHPLLFARMVKMSNMGSRWSTIVWSFWRRCGFGFLMLGSRKEGMTG